MQFAPKFSRISTFLPYIICCHLKKIGKVSKIHICIPHTLREKNKEDHISIVKNRLSRQINDSFLKKIITGDKKMLMQRAVNR